MRFIRQHEMSGLYEKKVEFAHLVPSRNGGENKEEMQTDQVLSGCDHKCGGGWWRKQTVNINKMLRIDLGQRDLRSQLLGGQVTSVDP